MRKRHVVLGTVFILGSALTWAAAESPVRGLNEVYSNADRTVQFVVHATGSPGQEYLGGQTLVASGAGTTHTFTFPSNLPGDSVGRSFLVATQGFADLNVLQPDYVVPNAGGRYAFAPATLTPAIGPGITGAWFNPAQGDQAFMLEVLAGAPMQMLATWIVYAPQGGPAWIFGLGPIIGDGATIQGIQSAGSGARFPPNSDAANIQVVPWGTLAFRFSDCNHGHVDWTSSVPGYGSGAMDLVRLTLPAGLECLADAPAAR